jgi:iron complex transport system ATP-binding protein
MTESLLRVQQATFVRGGRRILEGIDWQVDPGQHWCILGPNGCGKTSLINLITGYDTRHRTANIQHRRQRYFRRRATGARCASASDSSPTPSPPIIESPASPCIHVVASGREAKLNLIAAHLRARRKSRGRWKLHRGQPAARITSAKSLWGTALAGREAKESSSAAPSWPGSPSSSSTNPAPASTPSRGSSYLALDERDPQPPARRHPSLVMVTHHVEEILPCISRICLLRKAGHVHAAGRKGRMSSPARPSASSTEPR